MRLFSLLRCVDTKETGSTLTGLVAWHNGPLKFASFRAIAEGFYHPVPSPGTLCSLIWIPCDTRGGQHLEGVVSDVTT